MNWIEKIAFKIIEKKFEKGKVLFLEDMGDLTKEIKDYDKLWSIIKQQQKTLDEQHKMIVNLQYEIDSPMVLLNEIRNERKFRR